jgi:hypothetical protein
MRYGGKVCDTAERYAIWRRQWVGDIIPIGCIRLFDDQYFPAKRQRHIGEKYTLVVQSKIVMYLE